MKTIIFTWSQKFNINNEHLEKYNHLKETNFFFGLGDLIRASIKLYSLSKKMNFRLIVDLQLHPISTFLKAEIHEYSFLVLKNKNNIDYICYGAVVDFIKSKPDDSVSFLFTNDFYDGEITEDIKIFIKNILQPTDVFQKFINYKLEKIKIKPFQILHYRLNDDEFLNKNNNNENKYKKLFNHFLKIKENSDILISDTQSFKDYVFQNNGNIMMYDINICHLGLSSDKDAIRDTLFEFFLITYSSKIKTYCRIHHMSGFVKWISKIYDIPVSIL
jgi:hypothetical protein